MPETCPHCQADISMWGHEHGGKLICTRCTKVIKSGSDSQTSAGSSSGPGEQASYGSAGPSSIVCEWCGASIHVSESDSSRFVWCDSCGQRIDRQSGCSTTQIERRSIGSRPNIPVESGGCALPVLGMVLFVSGLLGALNYLTSS